MDIGGKVENLKFHDTLPNDNSGCSLEEVQKALKVILYVQCFVNNIRSFYVLLFLCCS